MSFWGHFVPLSIFLPVIRYTLQFKSICISSIVNMKFTVCYIRLFCCGKSPLTKHSRSLAGLARIMSSSLTTFENAMADVWDLFSAWKDNKTGQKNSYKHIYQKPHTVNTGYIICFQFRVHSDVHICICRFQLTRFAFGAPPASR